MTYKHKAGMAAFLATALGVAAQNPTASKHPKVQPGPNEPDWVDLLDKRYHLDMEKDLLNPQEGEIQNVRALFEKAGPGAVTFAPEIALGLEVAIHGGFYLAGTQPEPALTELWSYQHKSTTAQVESGEDLTPPLKPSSSTEFDPGDKPFGLYVENDEFHDRVYTEPVRVSTLNPRLAKQPYKVMIYPYRDRTTGKLVPNTYLIGWEYSTNDDFQDVVCRIGNVKLLKPESKP